MSHDIAEAKERSEDHERTDDVTNDVRLVPLTESVRYRKRAQVAEEKVEQLTEQLSKAQSDTEKLSEQMGQLKSEQALSRKLVAAGVNDLETAMLVAVDRMEVTDKTDLDSVVEQLRSEKSYLFGPAEQRQTTMAASRTTPAKDRVNSGQSVLEKAAAKAAATGSRIDLQEYLKLRRNFL
jgi:uncharacterized protein YhaN